MRSTIIVFTGAGISAESGLKTFRDSGGLWEDYNIADVATPEAWEKNPRLVLDFYNKRRSQVLKAKPNNAHYALAELEKKFNVHIITQNIDDLHERAGSTNVLHLHGEINKCRSTLDASLIYTLKKENIAIGDLCEKGSQLRPHIVWFGETVPTMRQAQKLAEKSDFFIVVGTSLAVYPAAGIIDFVRTLVPKYLIDPGEIRVNGISNLKIIKQKASKGLPLVVKELLSDEKMFE